MNLKVFIVFPLIACLLCVQSANTLPRLGIFGERQRQNITVEGFKWKAGAVGGKAVFSEITLKNNDKRDYAEIVLKALFLSRNGRPAGSVRGRLKVELKAGETKTFTDVRLGTVGFNMDSVSSLEVSGARAAEEQGRLHPLTATGWDWRAGGYGGAGGRVASITVKNPSSTPYGKVKFLIVQKKAGENILSHPTRVKKIAEANAETVYKDVNPGFIHPDTDSIEVTVVSAYPVSEKQVALARGKSSAKNWKNGRGVSPPSDAETAVPGYDIEIKEFEWGSGVSGSLGRIKTLVLKNRSAVRYKEIAMSVEFLSRDGKTVLTENRFKIKNPPPPGETVVFKNLTVGIISVSPDKNLTRAYVRGGKPAR